MNLLKRDKLNETLTQNWTKFIDYRNLLELAINSIKLYANNWTPIQSNHNFKGNKIMVSKTSISSSGYTFIVNFELQVKECVAIGNFQLNIGLENTVRVSDLHGNLFIIQH